MKYITRKYITFCSVTWNKSACSVQVYTTPLDRTLLLFISTVKKKKALLLPVNSFHVQYRNTVSACPEQVVSGFVLPQL